MYKVLFPQDFIPAKRYTSYLNPAGQIEVRSHWLVLCRLCLLTSGRCVESVVYCASRSAEQMQWTERVSRELWHYTLCSKAKGKERGRFSTAPLGSQCTLYQTERLALYKRLRKGLFFLSVYLQYCMCKINYNRFIVIYLYIYFFF